MKQTAVEWFYDQITRTYWDYLTTERQNELFQQAKEMEKGQIEDAYSLSRCEWNKIISSSEYYNETFKK